MRSACEKFVVAGVAVLALSVAARGAGYIKTNLVSTDATIPAVQHDPNLVNAWGLAESGSSPFWVGDNGTGVETLYNTAGTPQALVVTVPPPSGSPAGTTSAPTGVVFGSAPDFGNASFLFVTEDGTLAGWNNSQGTTAAIRVDNSASGAVYKGLAKANNAGTNTLYAANFAQGRIDVFGPTFNPITPTGGFTVPNLPAGYAPFNIQNLGGSLYVAYAKKDPNSNDELDGVGLGLIAKFDANGSLLGVVTSGGNLNAPWGMAIAPANFGELSGDLLVGNFGDGSIDAFNPVSGNFIGKLLDPNGQPIVIGGLWALSFGNGGNGGLTNVLYFAAGPAGETKGLFGSIAVVPEPGTLGFGGVAGLGMLILRRRRR